MRLFSPPHNDWPLVSLGCCSLTLKCPPQGHILNACPFTCIIALKAMGPLACEPWLMEAGH